MLETDNKKKEIKGPENISSDTLGQQEAFEYASKENQHYRREQILELTSRVLKVVIVIAIVMIVVIAWHMIAPAK